LLSHVVYSLDDGREVSRAAKFYIVDGANVSLNDAVETVTLRIKDVSIDSKAVAGA